MICSLLQVFTLTQVLCVYHKHTPPAPRLWTAGSDAISGTRGGGEGGGVLACLSVCHRDVVRAAWFICLFLKSLRGSFWQKAPPEQAWTRVCFGWELRRSAYEETRGEEEKCQARGLRIWLCYVM